MPYRRRGHQAGGNSSSYDDALLDRMKVLSAHNAFVPLRKTNLTRGWSPADKAQKEQLGRALVAPLVEHRAYVPRGHFSAQLVTVRSLWAVMEGEAAEDEEAKEDEAEWEEAADEKNRE
ncbi:hypothetical protein CRENBAI_001675 [Crenichthys baileyi]|uniref:Uncharacterized protein n=1 Tax=Crenichthys baileyi TaxID=28760 RepID=A0AAV9RVK3_9TELE